MSPATLVRLVSMTLVLMVLVSGPAAGQTPPILALIAPPAQPRILTPGTDRDRSPARSLPALPPGALVYSAGPGAPPVVIVPAAEKNASFELVLLILAESCLARPEWLSDLIVSALATYVRGLATPPERLAFANRVSTYPHVREYLKSRLTPAWVGRGSPEPLDASTMRDRMAMELMDQVELVLSRLRSSGSSNDFLDLCERALIATLQLPSESYQRQRLVDQLMARPEIRRLLAGKDAAIDRYVRDGILQSTPEQSRRVPDWENRTLEALEGRLASPVPLPAGGPVVTLAMYARTLKSRTDRGSFIENAARFPLVRARYLDQRLVERYLAAVP
ncbi:MAG: hypothetical protein HY815_25525 [Candidatus Riflebacteria bacterium]|nr:hypothetical protein [Candidatus Riflebacteria bacterium]